MRVLLIGSGGREHALAWKLAQSERLAKLFVAPGNGGTAELAENVALDPADHAAVVAFAKSENIDFVVIGPDAPVVAGLGDDVRAAERRWHEEGINAVPAVIINNKYLISGGQPAAAFERALRSIAAEAA